MNVELRHLRAFVAVAEELNFTRAAARLHIAQQALSQQVRQLEDRVGTRLLDRTTRKVELTPAGAALLEQSRSLLAGADQAVAAALAAAGNGGGTLSVGFVAAVDHDHAGHALAAFSNARPDVEVRVHFGELTEPSGGLRAGDADVAFVHGPFDTTGLELQPLWSEPLGMAMAADHPLAELEEVPMEKFVAQPTFDFPTGDPTWHAYWMATAHRGGKPPKVVAQFRSLDALVSALRAGLGVHATARRLIDSLGPGSGIVYREVPGLEPLQHSIAWRTGDDRDAVRKLVDVTREAFGANP